MLNAVATLATEPRMYLFRSDTSILLLFTCTENYPIAPYISNIEGFCLNASFLCLKLT